MGQLTATQFRVTNFRNIDDSGWIPLDRVTAFVGRNESGKTTLLKALHKFNPASPAPFSPQHEFPRDRYLREFQDGKDWPVCHIEFQIGPELRAELARIAGTSEGPPTVTYTVHYDGSKRAALNPDPVEDLPSGAPVISALDALRMAAAGLSGTAEQEAEVQTIRTDLLEWADAWKSKFADVDMLRADSAVAHLNALRKESSTKANPHTAAIVVELQSTLGALHKRVTAPLLWKRMTELTDKHLPVFIYFDRYGVLDSAIYLPRFLEDLKSQPDNARVRTVNAMFKHVRLSAEDLVRLGQGKAEAARVKGETVTPEMIEEDRRNKDLRAIQTSSASLDISQRFSDWWKQRRHAIRYDVDGDYFRIWVADDLRPKVEIELESRSAGFQWFFSFYLVFLVEAEEGFRDAVLLLDEPGLQLHPTAQQELISFFDKLAEANQLLYTTHSPFLIDGDHLERIRPVTEDKTGHSRISVGEWPKDRETIFPLHAAAGYAMIRGLFQHRKNVLVEGMGDYFYLHALSLLCNATGRPALPADIYITPCGGTKLVGHLASLFLGHNVRPVILLDSDEAGRIRRDALMKELYVGHADQIVMLGEVLGVSADWEIEDIVGEALVLPELNRMLPKPIKIETKDRAKGALVDHIKAASTRLGIPLPDGWKAEVARTLVSHWATIKPESLSAGVLDKAAALFTAIRQRFETESAATPEGVTKSGA